MTPLYCFRCPECQIYVETIRPMEDADKPYQCPQCGSDCKRNFQAESVISTFHPTVDLYALKKKQDIKKNKRPPLKERY